MSQGQTGFVPGTNRGSSQGQPDQKVYVMCLFLGGEKAHKEYPHNELKGPQHKDLRAQIPYVGESLLLDFPGKEPPHKEFLGGTLTGEFSAVFLYVYVSSSLLIFLPDFLKSIQAFSEVGLTRSGD